MDKETKIRVWGKDKKEITLLVLITVPFILATVLTPGAILVTAFFWSSVVQTVLTYQHEKKMNYKKASILVFFATWLITGAIRYFV